MNKETVTGYIAASGIAIAFIVICILLYLSPNSKRLISSKLRLGAALLALTTIAVTQQSCSPHCYDPVEEFPPNTFDLNTYNDTIDINLNSSNEIRGEIKNCASSEYSYRIEQSDSVLQNGDIISDDGAWDGYYEYFKIHLNDTLPSGFYDLLIFAGREEDDRHDAKFVLNVTGIE